MLLHTLLLKREAHISSCLSYLLNPVDASIIFFPGRRLSDCHTIPEVSSEGEYLHFLLLSCMLRGSLRLAFNQTKRVSQRTLDSFFMSSEFTPVLQSIVYHIENAYKDTLVYDYNRSKSSSLSLYLATVLRTLELSTHVTKSSRLREIKNAGSVTT